MEQYSTLFLTILKIHLLQVINIFNQIALAASIKRRFNYLGFDRIMVEKALL